MTRKVSPAHDGCAGRRDGAIVVHITRGQVACRVTCKTNNFVDVSRSVTTSGCRVLHSLPPNVRAADGWLDSAELPAAEATLRHRIGEVIEWPEALEMHESRTAAASVGGYRGCD